MPNWFLQLVFDKFDFVFIFNSLDLNFEELTCFLDCQKFFIDRGTITKISGWTFLVSGFLNAGLIVLVFIANSSTACKHSGSKKKNRGNIFDCLDNCSY